MVSVEEHSVIGGLGSAVCDVLSEKCPTQVMKIGINDTFGESGPAVELIKKYGLDADSIYEKVISSSILNAEHSAIPGLMNEIIRESEEKQYGYELAIKNHIGGIFLWLLRYWHANGEEPLLEDFENQQLKQQLSPALTYMITNYEKSISAADMAKLCNLSYSYFSRSFNRLLHMNFSDYLNEIRIREAEKLLVSTTQNVTEIASAVGFCTTSYFIKQFTKYLHISPKQYQKQMRQGTERFHCITTQHKL